MATLNKIWKFLADLFRKTKRKKNDIKDEYCPEKHIGI